MGTWGIMEEVLAQEGMGNFQSLLLDMASEHRGSPPGVQKKVVLNFSFTLLYVSENQTL